MSTSLRVYARTHAKRRGPQCFTCRLPPALMRSIRQGVKRGVTYSVISDWLRTKGHRVGGYTLAKHFREHEQA